MHGGKMCPPSKCSPGRHLKPWCVGGWQPWLFPWGECPCCTSCSLSPSPTKTQFSAGWMEAGRWRTPSSLLWTRSHLDQKRSADDHGWHYVMFFPFSLCVVCVCWTFAVLPVEEWHVKDSGRLLFPLENIAGPWPVFLLQEFLLQLWERFLQFGCIVSGENQSLCGEFHISFSWSCVDTFTWHITYARTLPWRFRQLRIPEQ